MSEDQRLKLLRVHTTGDAGKANMEIWMGPLFFDYMCAVADIMDEVLPATGGPFVM